MCPREQAVWRCKGKDCEVHTPLDIAGYIFAALFILIMIASAYYAVSFNRP